MTNVPIKGEGSLKRHVHRESSVKMKAEIGPMLL